MSDYEDLLSEAQLDATLDMPISLNDFESMVEETLFEAPDLDDTLNLAAAEAPGLPQGEDPVSERYALLDALGEGAMGEVLLARDKMLYRKVAYKRIRPEFVRNAGIVNRFYKEAQITSQLEHPGVIPVYSMEQMQDKSLAYAMKWLKGSTLKEKITALRAQLQSGQLQRAEWHKAHRQLLETFIFLCDTLHYAHSKGVIHRDLKPANIMLGAYGEVYILDWGVAGLTGEVDTTQDEQLEAVDTELWCEDIDERTLLGNLVGTPRYMSPEQAKGLPTALSHRSDLYALGLILYELCYLRPAYTGTSLKDVLEKVTENKYLPQESEFPQLQIGREMKAIIAHCLQAEPEARYASAEALADEVRLVLQDLPPQVLPDTLPQAALRWTRHHPQASLMGALSFIVLALTAAIVSMLLSQRALEQTRIHEMAVNDVLTQTTQVARHLDGKLAEYEALMEYLAARASETYLRGTALNVTAPPQQAPGYAKASWLPPEPPTRFLPLQTSMQKIHARALDESRAPHTLLTEFGRSPLRWSTVAFEKGPQIIYPGTPQPEVVQAIFQREANQLKQDFSPHWATVQKLGDTQVLPLYQALYSDQGQYLGWSALAIETQTLRKPLMGAQLTGLQQVLLVDAQAQPILQWQPPAHPSTSPQPLSLPSTLQQQWQQRSGFVEHKGHLLSFQALGKLQAFVVLDIAAAELYQEKAHGLQH